MINHIEIIFNGDDLGNLKLGHNSQILLSPIDKKCVKVDIHGDTIGAQTLWIQNSGDHDIEIDSLSMFGHGSSKLKFLGSWISDDGTRQFSSHWIHARGKWYIEYQYPTFSWVHQKLHYGWLVKPVGR